MSSQSRWLAGMLAAGMVLWLVVWAATRSTWAPPGVEAPSPEGAVEAAPEAAVGPAPEAAAELAPEAAAAPWDPGEQSAEVEEARRRIRESAVVLEDPLEVFQLPVPEHRYLEFSWSPDGRYLAYKLEGQAKIIPVYFPSAGEPIDVRVPDGGDELGLVGMFWFPDIRLGTWDCLWEQKLCRVFAAFPDDPIARQLFQTPVGLAPIGSASVAADGEQVVMTFGTDIRLWTPATGGLDSLSSPGDHDLSPVFSPDGSRLAWARRKAVGLAIWWRARAPSAEHLLVLLRARRGWHPSLFWLDDQTIGWKEPDPIAGRHIAVSRLDGERRLIAVYVSSFTPVERGEEPSAWLAYVPARDDMSGQVAFASADARRTVVVRTPHVGIRGLDATRVDGRVLLAYSGANPDTGERRLYVTDVTHVLEAEATAAD